MADISLSKAVRSNLLSLKGTADMMAKTQERLATGNKVNSALDNPTNFFTASGLNARASDMNQLMDGMANGIQTLEAADNGLSSITKTLESMQSTLRQARQDKSFETSSLNIDAATIGTATPRNITLSGGALESAKEVGLQNNAVTGNNGFVNDGTAGRDGSFTLKAESLNNDNAVTFKFTKEDTAETAAAKINERLSKVGKDSGLSASVVEGQLKITSSKGEDITITDVSNTQAIGLKDGAVDAADVATATGADIATGKIDASEITINGEKISLESVGVAAAAPVTASTAAENAASLSELINNSDVAMKYGITAAADGNKVKFTQADGRNFSVKGTSVGFVAETNTATPPASGAATAAVTGVQKMAKVDTPVEALEVKTVDQLVSQINSMDTLKAAVRASNDNGKLRIQNLSTQDLKMDGVSSSGSIDGSSTGASEIAGNSIRAGLADQFNELRDQLDKLSDDASFNGINLLQGDKLQITFNETGTSSIDIQTKEGKTINATNLGVATTLDAKDLDSDDKIDSFLKDIKSALNDVRSQSSSFGSNLSIVQNRQDFTKSMINTLQTGAANLTLADMNEEAANLLALQTRQSLSSNSLSLASQADQSVLQLIR
jgi:flagellin